MSEDIFTKEDEKKGSRGSFIQMATEKPENLKKLMNIAGKSEKEIEIINQIQEINKLLDEQELNVQYLDLGYTNDFWYYGKNIRNKEAIITSNKKLLRNTIERTKDDTLTGTNEIKEHIAYEGYIGNIAPVWDNTSIKQFLFYDERINPQDVFKRIKDTINYFMDFQEFPESADVQACWVIGTYCYPLFYCYPHILFNAPTQSGKSKNAYVLMKLSFRGYDLGTAGGVSPAQIFRTIEGNRGTLLFDEFEQVKGNETQMLVNQILNSSIQKESYVIRTEQINSKWVAKKFPIYCPKIACNISGINPTSLSRFIPFTLFRTTTEKGKRKPYRESEKIKFKPISDDCHILILQNWKTIKEIYNNIKIDLNNRDEDLWMSMLTIAKFISNEVYNNVLKYIKTYQEIKISSDDIKQDIFLAISEKVTDDLTFFSCKEISGWLSELIGHYKSPETYIGKLLKSYKFKKDRKHEGTGYYLSKENINNILKTYFPSTCTEQVTQDTLTTLLTQDTQDTQERVTCVCNVATQEGDGENSIYENKKDHFKRSLALYPEGMLKDKAIELWGEVLINKSLKEGVIMENPSGILRLVI